jgi:hypothetical protein
MKFKVMFITLLLSIALFTGCSKQNTDNNPTAQTTPTVTTPADTTTDNTTTDVVTTASIVDTEDAFVKAISKQGTWIIAILKDMTVNQDLNLEGEFKNGKKDDAGKDIIQRKLAFYSQDENRNITARYTLTAPKLTINSPMASIQHGTFKGDVYVNVSDFQLIDATVDGNVYFTTADAQSTFKMDDTSKITGKQELQK